jgi:enoyl-CoA hydratase
MMHCDIVIASETSKFGQPEINIGVMPGAGGTQRLARAVGKAAAMDIVLSGRFLSAKEALKFGLVSRVVPKEHWFEESLNVAKQVATKGPIALRAAKASVLNAEEMNLSDGLSEERQLFYSLFDTNDQTEGMTAFIEKRNPNFSGT